MLLKPMKVPALQERLKTAQNAAASIVILEQLRAKLDSIKCSAGGENLEWYGPYYDSGISGGIAALAASIDSELDDAHALLDPDEA